MLHLPFGWPIILCRLDLCVEVRLTNPSFVLECSHTDFLYNAIATVPIISQQHCLSILYLSTFKNEIAFSLKPATIYIFFFTFYIIKKNRFVEVLNYSWIFHIYLVIVWRTDGYHFRISWQFFTFLMKNIQFFVECQQKGIVKPKSLVHWLVIISQKVEKQYHC